MAAITVQQITLVGITPTFAAVSSSDTAAVAAGAVYFAEVKNAGGTQDVVTVTDAGITPGGSAATSPTVTVPITTGDKMFYLPVVFANSSSNITLLHSFTTTVTQGVFRVG
jgi:hypothetical protein